MSKSSKFYSHISFFLLFLCVSIPLLASKSVVVSSTTITPVITAQMQEKSSVIVTQPSKVTSQPKAIFASSSWIEPILPAQSEKVNPSKSLTKSEAQSQSTPFSLENLPIQSIYYPSLGLSTRYNYSQIEDYYTVRDGIVDYSQPLDTSSPGTRVQNKLLTSPLHVAFTPRPGAAKGNSYFIAHNTMHFAPLMYKGSIGDMIYIKQENGVVLQYKVYEARTIATNNPYEAYNLGETKSTITLQTCTENDSVRWIIRAELQ